MAATRRWVLALCSVVFDTDKGQTLEECYPIDALSEEDLLKIANLALPDSNTGSIGDVVHTFRVRIDKLPLLSTSSLQHQYLFGFCFFRQSRDASARRGFVQRSVVIITELPFVSLFKRAMRLLGPIHASAGSAVLEAAFLNINAWPAPRPGSTLELPLLGSLLSFVVPWTGLQSFTPVLSSSLVRGSAAADTPARAAAASIPPSSSGTDLMSAAASVVSGTSPTDSGDASVHSSNDDEAHDFDESLGSPIEVEGSVDDTMPGSLPVHRQTLSCPSTPLQHASRTESPETTVPPVDLSSSFELLSVRQAMESSSAPSSPLRVCKPPPSPPSPVDRGPITLDSAFSEKQAVELPGLYQDIGLFSTFRGLCHSLWHLWELAITGQPIIVVGTKPELVGDAVLAIVSLISPLVFSGDYRPFFSLYDPDFKEIVSVHERCRGAGMPCYILGTTNPFFIKSLEFWPNAIWLTPPIAAPSVFGDGSSSPSASAASSKPQMVQPDRIKPRVIPPLTSLSSVLPLPGQDSLAKVCLVCRADALVPPDTRTLGQLLSIKATEELEPQLRLGPDESGITTSAAASGLVPAVMINNALLRQHFRQLTLQFLKAFNRYFHVDTVQIVAHLSEGNIGLYDDLALHFLPKFSEEEFFANLKAEGPPKLLAKANCKKLYKGFIDSCHFWPWFKAKEQHAVRKLHMIARAARMGVSVAALLTRLGDGRLSIAGLSPRLAALPVSPARSLKPHSASPSVAHSRSPKREAVDRRSMMSFFTQSKAARSPTASTTASPLAARVQQSDVVSAFADFHARICAAFTREERLLNKDPELTAVMMAHLNAVDASLQKFAAMP